VITPVAVAPEPPAPGSASVSVSESSGRDPSSGLWFLRVLAAFARREARLFSGYRLAFLVRGVAFAMSVLALAFLGRLVDAGAAANPHLGGFGGNYLAFAVVGLVVLDLQQVAVSALSQRIRTAQLIGVIEAELATPAPAWIVLGVAPVYELGAALVRGASYICLAAVLFGVSFPRVHALSLALALTLVLLACLGLGLLSAAATMLARRTNPIAVLLGSASLLLGGVAYPVSVLPPWLRTLGRALPLTHALEAVRGAMLLGAGPSALARPLVALAVLAAVLVPVGIALFLLVLRRARVDGSLTHY
jgi:ABC-2 type transport system permease protein